MSDVPNEFLCPISLEIMTDPVVCADGHTYERACIEEWFTLKTTSPVTNDVVENTTLVPNHSLRCLIQQWQDGTLHRTDVSHAEQAVAPGPPPQLISNRILDICRSMFNELGLGTYLQKFNSVPTVLSRQWLTQRMDSILPVPGSKESRLQAFMLVASIISISIGKSHLALAVCGAISVMCTEHISARCTASIISDFENSSTLKQFVFVAIGIMISALVMLMPIWYQLAFLLPTMGLRFLMDSVPRHMKWIRQNMFFGLFLFFAASRPTGWLSTASSAAVWIYIAAVYKQVVSDRDSYGIGRDIAFYGSLCCVCIGYFNFVEFRLHWFMQSLVLAVSRYDVKLTLEWYRSKFLKYTVYINIFLVCLWPRWTLLERFQCFANLFLLQAERYPPSSSARQAMICVALTLAFVFPSAKYDNTHYLLRGIYNAADISFMVFVKFLMVELIPFMGTTRNFREFCEHLMAAGAPPGENVRCYVLIESANQSFPRFQKVQIVSSNSNGCFSVRISGSTEIVEVSNALTRRAEPFEFTRIENHHEHIN